MQLLLLVLIGCVIAISFIVVVVARQRLKNKAEELVERLKQISVCSAKDCYAQTQGKALETESVVFVDIDTDINNAFCRSTISISKEKFLTDHYLPYFQEASSLVKKLKSFNVVPPVIISNMVREFEDIRGIIKRHNTQVIKYLLDTYKDFFDHCLDYPLDMQQRRSIVSEEDNCLVVSSAGSGKTSSIIGKVKYLTEIKGVDPRKILLISYTNKAAAELTDRMATDGLRGYTFHKLAIDIIGKATGIKPSICDNTDALFVNIYHDLSDNKSFKKSIIKYFVDYQSSGTDKEKAREERQLKLTEKKQVQFKAIFPDMDGRTIYVKSQQEQKICFILSSLGVKFRYEESYEYQLADEMYSQYRPDFSIYFERNGVTKRIYLEHFGVDEHSLVPAWFAKDKNMTYEEANKKYNDGITWKKTAHEKFGTQLLTTSSADFYNSDIKVTLKKMLEEAGVPIQEKSDEELYDLMLPQGCKQEKAFIRLVATFVTLAKSSCKSVKEILKYANSARDERSAFIIENIFCPVYEHYIRALKERGQVDFIDVILQATEICRASHPVEYDYIIVDEFQDISVDRYSFLKVLRAGPPPG